MSNFENWKTALTAFNDTEAEYCAAHNAVIDAGSKRSKAWDALCQAASMLSVDEKRQAAEYQFGE